jgi:hypothetical protein
MGACINLTKSFFCKRGNSTSRSHVCCFHMLLPNWTLYEEVRFYFSSFIFSSVCVLCFSCFYYVFFCALCSFALHVYSFFIFLKIYSPCFLCNMFMFWIWMISSYAIPLKMSFMVSSLLIWLLIFLRCQWFWNKCYRLKVLLTKSKELKGGILEK